MTTRRRRAWKPKRSAWITLLGLINAIALLLASTAGLGLPDTAIKWVTFIGGVALLIRETLQREAQTEALHTPPPKGTTDAEQPQ